MIGLRFLISNYGMASKRNRNKTTKMKFTIVTGDIGTGSWANNVDTDQTAPRGAV